MQTVDSILLTYVFKKILMIKNFHYMNNYLFSVVANAPKTFNPFFCVQLIAKMTKTFLNTLISQLCVHLVYKHRWRSSRLRG
jgi:hypothetical protein